MLFHYVNLLWKLSNWLKYVPKCYFIKTNKTKTNLSFNACKARHDLDCFLTLMNSNLTFRPFTDCTLCLSPCPKSWICLCAVLRLVATRTDHLVPQVRMVHVALCPPSSPKSAGSWGFQILATVTCASQNRGKGEKKSFSAIAKIKLKSNVTYSPTPWKSQIEMVLWRGLFSCPEPIFCFPFEGFLCHPQFHVFLWSFPFLLWPWWVRDVDHGPDEEINNFWVGEIPGE